MISSFNFCICSPSPKIKSFVLLSFFIASYSFAALAPEELVRKTASDVISEIKKDKDIQDGNREKIYRLAEEKILPNFDFTRILLSCVATEPLPFVPVIIILLFSLVSGLLSLPRTLASLFKPGFLLLPRVFR